MRVYPFAGLAGRDIGLVLVVGRQQLDGLAQYLAAKVVNRHLYGNGTVLAFHIGIKAGHVGDEADLDFFLCHDGGREGRRQGESQQAGRGRRLGQAMHGVS